MATLLWQRDVIADVGNVKNTFSSWDSCMAKGYCKWPVIVAIIVASLIIFSIIWCVARCLCCGMECCCGCFSCCNRCCPSPRGGRRKHAAYAISPPQPQQPYSTYDQYKAHHAPPVYASGGLGARGPQTATFDTPTNRAAFNGDALPAMPSWDNAQTKHVEEEEVEMEKLDHPQAQQQALLSHHNGEQLYQNPHEDNAFGSAHPSPLYNDRHQHVDSRDNYQNTPYGQRQQSPDYDSQYAGAPHSGDLGAMSPGYYHDDRQYQQSYASPYASQQQSLHQTSYQSHTPASPSIYSNAPGQPQPLRQTSYQSHTPASPSIYSNAPNYGRGCEPSVAPSYHTRAQEHVVSPIVSPQPQYPYPAGRNPAQGPYNHF